MVLQGKGNRVMRKIIMAVLVFLIIGIILIYYPAFPHNKNKAKEIAVEYVNENFEQEMKCLGVSVSVWETVLYSVYFSPVNSPDIIFEVMLSANFELPDHPDNYVIKYYEKEMYSRLDPIVKSIWETEGKALLINHQPLLGFRIEEGLNENSAFEDIHGKLPYSLWVNIDADIKDLEIQTETAKIYEFIKVMQEEEYMFEEIAFFYNDKSIEFKNWKAIKDIAEFILNELACNVDNLFVKTSMTFAYVMNENSGLPREMIEQLQQALLSNTTEDFLKRNSANYNIIPEEEREKHAEKEKSGMLKEHQKHYKNSDEVWIEVGTPELYYVIRENLEDGNYLYCQFFYEIGSKIWAEKAWAWGKGEEYFFIQWGERVYLVTTNHDENGINGVAAYCCMDQGGDYGGMIYLERKNGEINIQQYCLSTTGTGVRGPGYVEY